MNRVERRRHEKLTKGKEQARSALNLSPLLAEGIAHQRAGRFPQAEQMYHQILQADPHHAEALHLLGLMAYRTGQLHRATELLLQATREDADQPTYWFNLGVVLQRQGNPAEAIGSYEQALRLNPRYPEAQSNVGNALMEQGKLNEAVEAYRAALQSKPDYVEAHNNLGVALKEQGRFQEARACYEKALELAPTHVEAHCNLGSVLMDQGHLDEAVASLERALQIKPGYVKALYHLAFACLWLKRFEKALSCLRQSADLKHNQQRAAALPHVSPSRLKHDVEQIQYLLDRGCLSGPHEPYLEALKGLRRRAGTLSGTQARLTVTKEEWTAISPSFTRLLHYSDSPWLNAGAVNLALDVAAIEARYNAGRPEVMYLDGLLTDDALASLRRFCLESTIWMRDYENGYLGAFLGDGFSCPLLLQIAEELRVRFPGIFREHRLTQAWAFKYDSERTGLNIHADAAAVNVNFWITPDDANFDPARGGLVVWDKEAPKEWNFKEYNSSRNEAKVRAFLDSSGATAISIPYRANRAVIFNSDLFHETDQFHFKDEYESRRLNVTLLYGRRKA